MITTSGFPKGAVDIAGDLPAGVSWWNSVYYGTGTISGTPAVGSGGEYPLTITADNGVGEPDVEEFTLTVNEAPSIATGGEISLDRRVKGRRLGVGSGMRLRLLSV